MAQVRAEIVDGEFRCRARPHCPGRLGRLDDAGRGVTSEPLWSVSLGDGWIFGPWKMGDDNRVHTEGGRWEATPAAQWAYDELRPRRAAGKLSPDEKKRMRQGPDAFAQKDRRPPRYRVLSPRELDEEKVYVLGLAVRQQASYLPTVVLCYDCNKENRLEAPSNSGR